MKEIIFSRKKLLFYETILQKIIYQENLFIRTLILVSLIIYENIT